MAPMTHDYAQYKTLTQQPTHRYVRPIDTQRDAQVSEMSRRVEDYHMAEMAKRRAEKERREKPEMVKRVGELNGELEKERRRYHHDVTQKRDTAQLEAANAALTQKKNALGEEAKGERQQREELAKKVRRLEDKLESKSEKLKNWKASYAAFEGRLQVNSESEQVQAQALKEEPEQHENGDQHADEDEDGNDHASASGTGSGREEEAEAEADGSEEQSGKMEMKMCMAMGMKQGSIAQAQEQSKLTQNTEPQEAVHIQTQTQPPQAQAQAQVQAQAQPQVAQAQAQAWRDQYCGRRTATAADAQMDQSGEAEVLCAAVVAGEGAGVRTGQERSDGGAVVVIKGKTQWRFVQIMGMLGKRQSIGMSQTSACWISLVCSPRVLCDMNIAEYEDHRLELEQNHASYGDHGTDNRSGLTCICSSTTVNGAFYLCPRDK